MNLPTSAAEMIRRVAHENDARVAEMIQVAIATLNLPPVEVGKQRRYNIETGEVVEE